LQKILKKQKLGLKNESKYDMICKVVKVLQPNRKRGCIYEEVYGYAAGCSDDG
jgi:hypothetical protein